MAAEVPVRMSLKNSSLSQRVSVSSKREELALISNQIVYPKHLNQIHRYQFRMCGRKHVAKGDGDIRRERYEELCARITRKRCHVLDRNDWGFCRWS
jgi:hypothetical protein